jgi:hypothetical protein
MKVGKTRLKKKKKKKKSEKGTHLYIVSYINVFVLIPSFYWYAYLVIKILGSKVTAQKVSKIALF